MPNKKPFTQAAAAFIVLALALVPLTPAFASDQGVIVGSLLTENNEPIQGKGIRFIERVPLSEGSWRLGDSTIAYTDKNGRFIVQATLGTYLVTVGPGKTQSGSRCLNTSFLYEVTQDRQNLEIVTPKLMTYSIQFSDTDGKKLVAGVRPYFRNVKFSSKASPGLGELSFYCDSEFFNTEPKFIWETFEISQNQNLPDQARYSYLNGSGQRIDTQLPEGSLNSQNVIVELPSIPSATVLKKKTRFDGNYLLGKAKFLEASDLVEFDLKRKFRVMYRFTGTKKPQRWSTFSGRFSPNSKGVVSFKLQFRMVKGKAIDLLLVGDDFSIASNMIRVKTVK